MLLWVQKDFDGNIESCPRDQIGNKYHSHQYHECIPNFEFEAEMTLSQECTWATTLNVIGTEMIFYIEPSHFMELYHKVRKNENGYSMWIDQDNNLCFKGEFTFNFQGSGMSIQTAKK